MIGRLLIGLLKGLVIGALVGYGLAAAGLTWGWLAYVAVAICGVIVAAVAGKPIWAQDSRIEVGAKAAAGAIIAPGLLWLVRSFVTLGLPFDPASLPGLSSFSQQAVTLGTFSVTSLAMVAAVLSGFFDADNDPKSGSDESAEKGARKKPANKRIEAADAGLEAAELEAAEAEAAQRKRRS